MRYDYLIVGQGIAGSLLSYNLLKMGKSVAVIDQSHHLSSSVVAAGLVNPITGRRFTKSWLIDTLIPYAFDFYDQLGKELNMQILDRRNVSMIFHSPKQENEWMLRSEEQDLQAYIETEPTKDQDYLEALNGVQGFVEFRQAGKVDMKAFVGRFKEYLQEKANYQAARFDHQTLQIGKPHHYGDLSADKIVFCEGMQATKNPFFGYLPYRPAKGEVLLVRIPDYPLQHKLVKHCLFIVHLREDIYWVGSSYDREYDSLLPTKKERGFLERELQSALKLPYEIIDHQAAIRPTVRDRRPFMGEHPELKNLFIFNGLGAKGSYLGPYFSNQMANYLERGQPLMREVNIKRYRRYFDDPNLKP